MNQRTRTPPRKKRFRTPWGELQYVCKKIHAWLYQRKERPSARRYLPRLERILAALPPNDMAILKEEGLALLHELKGEIKEAIKHRQREIQLMEKLHDAVNGRISDPALRKSILMDRDAAALSERKIILQKLQKSKISDRKNRNGREAM
jgi:hypothetical protein